MGNKIAPPLLQINQSTCPISLDFHWDHNISSCNYFSLPSRCTAIFDIQGSSYDVELTEDYIAWRPMSARCKGVKIKRSRSSNIKRKLSRR